MLGLGVPGGGGEGGMLGGSYLGGSSGLGGGKGTPGYGGNGLYIGSDGNGGMGSIYFNGELVSKENIFKNLVTKDDL